MAAGPDEKRERLNKEIERVQDSARRRSKGAFSVQTSPGWRRGQPLEYLYKAGTVLVGDGDLPRVRDSLERRGVGYRVVDASPPGVTLLEVDTDVDALLDDLDGELGVGTVTPNHVLDVQGLDGLCPATEPEPATVADRWPYTDDGSLGNGVAVAVVDTGFVRGHEKELPWLAGVERDSDPDDDVYLPTDGHIAPYGGHGTFTAGVLLSVAPGARVTVDDVLVGGVVDEVTIVRQLTQALAKSPDVISISAGTYTRKNVPPKALSAFWDQRLRHHKGVAVVAAAGNNSDRQPFWPAAYPWVLSVGALSRDGEKRMEWSNHGGWVDVYAPGEYVVNAFVNGVYRYLDGTTQEFKDRMARWSGTSFATPLVAGLIARRMAQTGENGDDAARAMRAEARASFRPGVGPRLLP